MEVSPKSWTRFTRDEDLIAERMMRNSIVGHRYDAALLAALEALEKKGALRLGYYSWFGGSLRTIGENTIPAYAGFQNATGIEKLARLHKHLAKCADLHPDHAVEIGTARALAVPGAIVHLTEGGS